MNVLDENLEQLSLLRPRLARAILDSSIPSGWEWRPAKKAGWVLCHGGEALVSHYDPAKEAERQASSVDWNPHRVFVCLGVGSGHLIETLAQNPSSPLIVLEPELWRLRLLFSRKVSDNLFDPDRVQWAASSDPTELELACWALLDGERNLELGFIHPPGASMGSSEDRFDLPRKTITQTHEAILRDALAQKIQRPLWYQNIMRNLPFLAQEGDGSLVEGLFCGREAPAFLCAAGPSLARNAEELRSVGEKGLIIAVDTAVGTLYRLGVRPHIVVAVDANEANLHDFDGISEEWLGQVVLACDRIVHPAITAKPFKARFFFRTVNPIIDLEGTVHPRFTPLDSFTDRIVGPLGLWQSGGSVAANAFDLARKIGCSPLVLVGQDLAFTGGRAHAAGVGYESEWLHSASRFLTFETRTRRMNEKESPLSVEAQDGGRIATNPVLLNTLRWFEKTIAYAGMENVYNSTEGGAKITGARSLPLKEAVGRFCAAEKSVSRTLDEKIKTHQSEALKRKTFLRIKAAAQEYAAVERGERDGCNFLELCSMAAVPVEDPRYAEALSLAAGFFRRGLEKALQENV